MSGVQGLAELSAPDFAVTAATGAVAICGCLLLSIGVIEAKPDFSWMDPDFAEAAETAGSFIPSLIGAALIVLAMKMAQRVALAWGLTIGLLLIAAMYTISQGERLWVTGALIAAALLVMPFRTAFYRKASLFSGPLQAATAVPMAALAVCVLALAAFEPHVRWLTNDSWWGVILSPDVPNSLRLSVALTVGIGMVAIGRLLRPGRVQSLAWNADSRLSYAALGALPPAAADGIVWGEANRAAIAYRRVGGVLLALGDPVGAASDQASAIWRLRDLAVQDGLDPAVWRAGPNMLKVYADLGLSALKLGPDGLPDNTDAEEPTPSSRYLVCKVERDLKSLLPALPSLTERAAAE